MQDVHFRLPFVAQKRRVTNVRRAQPSLGLGFDSVAKFRTLLEAIACRHKISWPDHSIIILRNLPRIVCILQKTSFLMIFGCGLGALWFIRDCSLFMARRGRGCLEWGGKIFKTKGNGEVCFFNTGEYRGVNFENPFFSTLLLPFCRYTKLSFVLRTLCPKSTDTGSQFRIQESVT